MNQLQREDTLLDGAESIEAPEPIARKRRRGLWVLVCVVGVLVVMPAIMASVVVYLLAESTLRLDFARSQIEHAIKDRLPKDATVAIGPAALSYRADQGLQLRADSLHLNIPGRAALDIGSLTTAASVRALFGGKLDLSSVRIDDATIALRPSGLLAKDGATSAFNTNQSGSQADAARRVADRVARSLANVDDQMRHAGLDEVHVTNSRIVLGEEGVDPLRVVRITDASWIPVSPLRSKSWVQILTSTGGSWDLTLERETLKLGSGVVVLHVDNLPTGEVAPVLADPTRRPSYPALISAETRIVYGQDGHVAAIRGAFSTGAGLMQLSKSSLIQVAGISLTFLLPGEGDQLSIPRAEIRTKSGDMAFGATANLGPDRTAIRIAGQVLGGSLPTGRPDPASLRLKGGSLSASLDLVERSIRIDKMDLSTEVGDLSLIGQASMGGEAAGLSFALSVGEVPAVYARALWPPFMASKTRKWFDENVVSGTVGPATMRVALPPEYIGSSGRTLPNYAILGTLPFHDGVFSPLTAFPKIHGAVGTIAFADAAATVTAQSGVMTVPGFGDVDAAGTVLVIREIGNTEPEGQLHLQVTGGAAAVAALSNTPPLSVAKKRGIEPTDLAGDMQLSLDTDVPLYTKEGSDSSAIADLEPSFRMALSHFSSKAPISGRQISDADLVLEGTSDSYTVKGRGKLDGVEATVDLLTGSGETDQADVKMALDDAARKRIGLSFGDYVTGPVQASIRQMPDGKQQVALDLQDARVNLAFIGWEKGKGVPATAKFDLIKNTDGSAKIENLVVAGKGFSAKGTVSVATGGELAQINLSQVALRSGDQLSFRADAKDGGYDVAIKGDAFDARGLLQQIRSGFGKSDGGNLAIRASVDVGAVTGQNSVTLQNVSGSLALTGSRLDRVALRGATGDGGSFEWTVGKEGAQRVMRVLADNGGALIRGLGIYEKIAGGNLVIDYSGSVPDQGTGSLVMRNFRLVGEEAIAPAFRTAVDGRDDKLRSAKINPADVHIEQMTVPFRREGWVFAIGDASVKSPMIGATASGTINLPDGKLALSGTFIPAFGLNNIAASVPILGVILGGGRNEGLLGITYKLFGPLDRPQLAMNPLSAIAPGIFRKIFDYR